MILFSHKVYIAIPIQKVVASNIDVIRQSLFTLQYRVEVGTSMYSALAYTFTTLLDLDLTIDSWVVCLTDGESNANDYDVFRQLLTRSQQNQHLVIVGVALPTIYEQAILDMCQKFATNEATTGFLCDLTAHRMGWMTPLALLKARFQFLRLSILMV